MYKFGNDYMIYEFNGNVRSYIMALNGACCNIYIVMIWYTFYTMLARNADRPDHNSL